MEKMKIVGTLLALSITASYSYAADPVDPPAITQGKVEFTGKLIADTCSIETGKENIQVTLPTLSTQTLKTDGAQAGSKPFEIFVVDCPATISQVAAHFEAIGSTGTNPATGNLKNVAAKDSAAKNVEVRLYNSDEKQLVLGSSGEPFPVKETKATLRYYGGYYATAATTPGDVKATAMYTLSYP